MAISETAPMIEVRVTNGTSEPDCLRLEIHAIRPYRSSAFYIITRAEAQKLRESLAAELEKGAVDVA